MRGFSKAIITGNLTRDPELRNTTTGKSVCGFGVAVNRSYRDASGEQRDEVSFFDCSAWGPIGETIAKYAKKGSAVLVSGRLNQRSWEDKNGGKRSSVEIVVEDFNFLGGGNRDNSDSNYGGANSDNRGSSSAGAAAPTDGTPEEIPEGEIDLGDIPF
ncbi:single-stranded DNA-binding protein [Candidatus Saccharibacteria bacterium]|nr:single-stranded DNA-binding protein [Candidatus Saccharibacteria bacterium]